MASFDLLQLIPELGKIADNLISTNDDKKRFELAVKEIDIRELEARLGVQKAWLGNQSAFVAGAIPCILWVVSIVVVFNHIVAPLIAMTGKTLPVLDLPPWYSQLAGTIILGLLGKKAWDGTEIYKGGELVKPSRTRVEAPTSATPLPPPQQSRPYDDPEYINKRFAEMAASKGNNKNDK